MSKQPDRRLAAARRLHEAREALQAFQALVVDWLHEEAQRASTEAAEDKEN
jgi:hypothetical protein